jgi:hypothetical protein
MRRKLVCSFCGRPDDKVKRLIAGPKVFICDACVGTCNDILAKHPPPDAPPSKAASRPSAHRPWLRLFGFGRRSSGYDFAGSGPALISPR